MVQQKEVWTSSSKKHMSKFDDEIDSICKALILAVAIPDCLSIETGATRNKGIIQYFPKN